jgi:hypothetical protein
LIADFHAFAREDSGSFWSDSPVLFALACNAA